MIRKFGNVFRLFNLYAFSTIDLEIACRNIFKFPNPQIC